MKRQEMIKKNSDFNDIIQDGVCLKSPYFNIFYRERNDEYKYFGLAISKKIGNAVERNTLKRRMRAIVDNQKKMFKNGRDYIIMIKRGMKDVNFKQVEECLIKVLNRKETK